MRKLATIRIVDSVEPIPDADRIELAIVDGWKCVIKKGEFQPGDKVVYCEIDSFLPVRPEFEFLRQSSFRKMDDREGFRLRTVKLRGQISQGLLLPVSIVGRPVDVGDEVTDDLDIVKYEPPIPACLTGSVVGGFPSFIQKTDEERIQNMAAEFSDMQGRDFYVSEKMDGTSFTAFYNGDFGVCGRNYQYARDERNSYWRIVDALDLEERLTTCGRNIAVQGELTGPGIQSNRYGFSELRLFVFNIFDIDQYEYIEKSEMVALCSELGLETVPFIGTQTLPDTIDEILQQAEGKSVLNSKVEREGLVWVSGSGANRISFKTISNRFLAKEK